MILRMRKVLGERDAMNGYSDEQLAGIRDLARLRSDAIGNIRFEDGEVAGLLLLPVRDARRLLKQDTVPMSSALRASLPHCLTILDAG